MQTISKLFVVVCFFFFGCATARPDAALAMRHGSVHVDGPSVRAVAVGPGAIHAYSAFPGGALFVAPAVSGGDADCVQPAAAGAPRLAHLPADRVATLQLRAGQVACLATARPGSFELLWHGRPSAAPTHGQSYLSIADDGSL
jgi:hypothetical protein